MWKLVIFIYLYIEYVYPHTLTLNIILVILLTKYYIISIINKMKMEAIKYNVNTFHVTHRIINIRNNK